MSVTSSFIGGWEGLLLLVWLSGAVFIGKGGLREFTVNEIFKISSYEVATVPAIMGYLSILSSKVEAGRSIIRALEVS